MPHIPLPPLPGIAGLLAAHPDTAGALNNLAETLLRGPSPLTAAERETIAAYVSRRNDCDFCARTHAAVAHRLGPEFDNVLAGDVEAAGPKMRALLAIADRVRVDGRAVTPHDIADARAAGADDRTVHDTVLIAAAFCMFNRYVDGLAATTPDDQAQYDRHAHHLAENGYLGNGKAGR
ncbi:carboxymuconolactone decarboxylase family protein [Actinoplanes sp. GCM10030250]|uniref:carboxymuconolactone decarboxylase family protein n=1 Tax=Actinoplanes sp. GCM10030250 TaxID=3273376 RepID=UPI0036068EB3